MKLYSNTYLILEYLVAAYCKDTAKHNHASFHYLVIQFLLCIYMTITNA